LEKYLDEMCPVTLSILSVNIPHILVVFSSLFDLSLSVSGEIKLDCFLSNIYFSSWPDQMFLLPNDKATCVVFAGSNIQCCSKKRKGSPSILVMH
jgi:hypothetical protein